MGSRCRILLLVRFGRTIRLATPEEEMEAHAEVQSTQRQANQANRKSAQAIRNLDEIQEGL